MRGALEDIARISVDCGFKLHQALGPGLLESVYEVCLASSLTDRGLAVERQRPIPIRFNGLQFEEGFRADILVEGMLLIELKSTERYAPVHAKQVLTYHQVDGPAAGPAHEFRSTDIQGWREAAHQRLCKSVSMIPCFVPLWLCASHPSHLIAAT